jgi:hypothetical protein
MAICLLIGLVLFGFGCESIEKAEPTAVDAMSPRKNVEGSYGADLKSKLNYIIDRRLNEKEAIKVLKVFAIEDYDIQDKNTFWGHRAVAGSGGPYSEYYFTYKKKYFILFLQDKDTVNHLCLDIRMIGKTREEYELNAGKVEVDGRVIDEEVIVLVNKTWNGEYSTDILAAFKPVVSTRKIETLKYKTIRIYREE